MCVFGEAGVRGEQWSATRNGSFIICALQCCGATDLSGPGIWPVGVGESGVWKWTDFLDGNLIKREEGMRGKGEEKEREKGRRGKKGIEQRRGEKYLSDQVFFLKHDAIRLLSFCRIQMQTGATS